MKLDFLRVLSVLTFVAAGCATHPAGKRDVASIPKTDEGPGVLNLRGLRSIASQSSFNTDKAPAKVSAAEVAKLLEKNIKAFEPEAKLKQATAHGNTLEIEIENGMLGSSFGLPSTPRCHFNDDGQAASGIDASFDGEFSRVETADAVWITFAKDGVMKAKDPGSADHNDVIKSMNLKFSKDPSSGELKLLGFDLFDGSEGFNGAFNEFYSGRSLICSLTPASAEEL